MVSHINNWYAWLRLKIPNLQYKVKIIEFNFLCIVWWSGSCMRSQHKRSWLIFYIVSTRTTSDHHRTKHETSTLPLHKQSIEDEEYETLFANDADLIIFLTTLGDFIVTDHQLAFIDVIIQRARHETYVWASAHQWSHGSLVLISAVRADQQDDSTRRLHHSIYTWIATNTAKTCPPLWFDCDGSSWWYVHDDVYGDLFLAVSRLTLRPWQLAPVVQNTVFTDRSRNHPGVGSLIGIRSMSMTAHPRRSVYDTSSMAT